MRNIVFPAALAAAMILLSCTIASAQEDLKRHVEVTKAYTPEMGQADKLYARPRMADTVPLRPDISYSIRPAAWQTKFDVRPISAATIDVNMQEAQPLAWLKLGLGVPFQSTADIYFHQARNWGYMGAYLNHKGSYADIKSGMGLAQDATMSTNGAGFYVASKAGLRTFIGGSADLRYDYFTRYGLAVPANSPAGWDAGSPTLQSYSGGKAHVWFGNDFTDISALNFRLGTVVGTVEDRYSRSENNLSAYGEIAYPFSSSILSLKARMDGYYGGGDSKDYKNTIVTLAPKYSLDNNKFKLAVGFDMAFDNMGSDYSDLWIFPRVDIRWNIANGYFVPFLKVDGRLDNNGMEALSLRNPYIESGVFNWHNTARYNAHGGISGSFSSSFSYKAFAGASYYNNHVSFAYIYLDGYSGSFIPGEQDVLQLTVGGELSTRISGNFEAAAEARLHAYPQNGGGDRAAELPGFEVALSARYNAGKHLLLSAGVDVIGSRYFYATINPYNNPVAFVDQKVSPVADLWLKAHYKVNDKLGVFVEGRNLLNAKLYPYDHYRGQGVNIMGGITLRFGW